MTPNRRTPQFTDPAIKMLLGTEPRSMFTEAEQAELRSEYQNLVFRKLFDDQGRVIGITVVNNSTHVGGPIDPEK